MKLIVGKDFPAGQSTQTVQAGQLGSVAAAILNGGVTMATSTNVAPAAGTAPHPSWWARAGTWLLNIGKHIKNGLATAVAAEPKIGAAIAQVAPSIEAFSNLVAPGSGDFEAHLIDVYGYIAKVVADGGAAVNSITITTPVGSISLEAQLVQDIKDMLPQLQRYMHPAASTAPPAA